MYLFSENDKLHEDSIVPETYQTKSSIFFEYSNSSCDKKQHK